MTSPLQAELSGTHLIEASAGTGKTHTITLLFLRLLLERELEVGEILVVTYTNAATAELRERIRNRIAAARLACEHPGSLPASEADLRDLLSGRIDRRRHDLERLDRALRNFDEAPISTIHGFCQRVLQRHAFESGASFDADLLTDEAALREEIVRDFWVSRLHGADVGLVQRLVEQKLGPRSLDSLARGVIGNPDLRLLPSEVALPGEDDLTAWQKARRELAALYARARDEVADLLENDPALSHAKSAYHADVVKGLLADLGPALDAPTPAVSVRFPKLEMLTRDGVSLRLTSRGRQRNGAPDHPFFDACQRLWNVERAWRDQALALQLSLVEYARREAARRKERRNALSFDDLLVRVRDALAGPGGDALAAAVRGRHAAALIDEFQDTDPIQYEIFERIWQRAGGPLFLIGDPKQAIYGFRGADVFAYLRARDQAGAPLELDVNWRSDPPLLDALNCFFTRSETPFLLEAIRYHPVSPAPGRTGRFVAPDGTTPLQFLFFGGNSVRGPSGRITAAHHERLLAPAVAGEIVRFLNTRPTIADSLGSAPRPLAPRDIAVLCRTNRQARSVQDALRARGVPAVLQGDRSVFESEEAGELLAVLEAMADPSDPRLLRAALATPALGATANEIAAFERDDAAFDAEATRLVAWNEEWRTHGFMRAFRRMLEEAAVVERLLALPRGERRLTNLLHLAELLHRAAVTGHRGPHELIDWCRREIEEGQPRGELAPEEVQIRLESDAAAVTLTTIHKAKGLEWPVVYCPFLWSPSELRGESKERVRFHDADGALTLDLGSPDLEGHRSRAEREQRAEDLRLLYVALTRARHQCSVVWGGFFGAEGSPLGHFLAPHDVDLGSDTSIVDFLGKLSKDSGGSIGVRPLALESSGHWTPAGATGETLECRTFSGRLDERWRTSSFTALVSADRRLGIADAEGIDHDQSVEPAGGAPRTEPAAEATARPPLTDFPAGVRAGILIHEVLERIDFRRADPDELERTVDARMRIHGFEDRWREPLKRSLATLLDAPLQANDRTLRLADVSPDRRLNEMDFTLPVGEPGQPVLTPQALAEVFRRHGSTEMLDLGVPDRVAGLGFPALAGTLRGSIDLVFEHGGRFWLVDWKSNRLGETFADYGRARLAAAMAAHHYFVQYHLYTATLHRYLRQRLADWDYERDFGGVLYVFVRGVRRDDASSGVFFDRPSRAMVESLSALLAGSEDPS